GDNEGNRRKSVNGNLLPPSSSGLGHSPLTAKTGVRVPLGVLSLFCCNELRQASGGVESQLIKTSDESRVSAPFPASSRCAGKCAWGAPHSASPLAARLLTSSRTVK